MKQFTWQEPVTAGDKVPHSPDDKPCGDGWIPKEKDCHDGEAHRPKPGKNPYWSGDNSAEKRKDRGEPWENTKPQKKTSEPKTKEHRNISREKRENTKKELKNYSDEQEKALDPSRRTKSLKPENRTILEQQAKIAFQKMETPILLTLELKTLLEKESKSLIRNLLKEYNKLRHLTPTDEKSLDEFYSELENIWDSFKANPVAKQVINGERKDISKDEEKAKRINQKLKERKKEIDYAINRYFAEKREDDPRDILAWNTLETKPSTMRFQDIPDLAWKDFPEGPKNEQELKYIKEKINQFNSMFEEWSQSGGKVSGAYLGAMLLGNPNHYGEDSPFLPNPKAAKIVFTISAKAGDEESNDSLWYDFALSEQWNPNSYLHDYKKATQKAMLDLKKLGLDLEDIKQRTRDINKREKDYKKWEKEYYLPNKKKLQEEDEIIDELFQEYGPMPELRKREKKLIEDREDLTHERIKRVSLLKRAKKELFNDEIEKQRKNLLKGLEAANSQTVVPTEIFSQIANSFANPTWASLEDRKDKPEYRGEKGEKLYKKRQQARTRGEIDYKYREDLEKTFDQFTSILHKDLLSPERDVKNTDLAEIAWKYEVFERAYANKYKNTIVLDENTDPATMIHEFGHHLEYRNTRVHQRSLNFLEERTRGAKETPIRGFAGEVFKKGKFFNTYVGKIYGPRHPDPRETQQPSTEIISMGLEALYNKKSFNDILTKDPEHLALIIATIRGY